MSSLAAPRHRHPGVRHSRHLVLRPTSPRALRPGSLAPSGSGRRVQGDPPPALPRPPLRLGRLPSRGLRRLVLLLVLARLEPRDDLRLATEQLDPRPFNLVHFRHYATASASVWAASRRFR